MNLSAVILAGGQSRRMGRDKAWLKTGGQPLLARQIQLACELGAIEVFISGRPDTDYSTLGCRVLPDTVFDAGPLAGIERGLDASASPLLLVLAVDLAQMTAEFLRKLAAQCDPLTGVVPELAGEPEPLAAIYPKRCHALAGAAIADARLSARDFAAACRRGQLVRFWPVPAAEADYFSNWNRPADLPARHMIHRVITDAGTDFFSDAHVQASSPGDLSVRKFCEPGSLPVEPGYPGESTKDHA